MGSRVFRQPVIAPSFTASTQLASNIWGNLALSGRFQLQTESLTLSTAAKTVSSTKTVTFLTYGTSGKPNDAILQDPPAAGILKFIFLINNTTSVEANINTAASSHTFWGTTYNTATIAAAATGSPGGTPGGTPAFCLVAQSTTQWAILPGTTHSWDLSATTGSTATA